MQGFRVTTFRGKTPKIDPTAWVAPGCHIIGDVEIGPGASIWYNCVLRADVNAIRVGVRSNIQDGTVIHCDAPDKFHVGLPTDIGEDVLVGHMAMIHGARLMSGSFVGIGAIVMDGAEIAAGGMLGAGAMLTANKRIGENELWLGRPAKFVRELSLREAAGNKSGVHHYTALAQEYRQTTGQ